MRRYFLGLALSIATFSVAACTDRKDPLSPSPSKALSPIPSPLRPPLTDPQAFVEIVAGGNHTCARRYNGNVYCWGTDGLGTTPSPKLWWSGATQIAAGSAHACGLDASGNAYCWGAGDFGQLGFQQGAYIPSNGVAPVVGPIDPNNPLGALLPPLTFSSISAGGASSCGTTAGGIYCWGQQGSTTSTAYQAIPNLISTFNGASSLAVGSEHACIYVGGPLLNSSVYCWNADQYGQAGVNPSTASYYQGTSKVQFAALTQLPSSVTRVSAGSEFTCADAAGIVQCFGYNLYGALGNGTSGIGTETWVPQSVGNGQQLHLVAAGAFHACALDNYGNAYCWGWGKYGQLGDNHLYTPRCNWTLFACQSYPIEIEAQPQLVAGGHTYRAIAAGERHTCAIGTDNVIYCWGQNDFRQLGTNLYDAYGQPLIKGYSVVPVPTDPPQ